METLLEDLSFDAPEKKGESVAIDGGYVKDKLQAVLDSEDLSRFVL